MSGVGLLGGLASDSWSIDDGYGILLLIAVVAGLAGPLAALAGAFELRRAQAVNRSQTTGRVLLVAGTLGIALLAGTMFWTVIGPIVAVGIVVYWLMRLNVWRRELSSVV